MPGPGGEVPLLIAQLREGNQDAANQLVPLVYQELGRVAGACMLRERSDHTLQAAAPVHEAYLRLTGGESGQWQNRAHFFAIAAHSMRQISVDYARRRSAGKRGGAGARKVDIDEAVLISADTLANAVAIHGALERLAQIDPREPQTRKSG